MICPINELEQLLGGIMIQIIKVFEELQNRADLLDTTLTELLLKLETIESLIEERNPNETKNKD